MGLFPEGDRANEIVRLVIIIIKAHVSANSFEWVWLKMFGMLLIHIVAELHASARNLTRLCERVGSGDGGVWGQWDLGTVGSGDGGIWGRWDLGTVGSGDGGICVIRHVDKCLSEPHTSGTALQKCVYLSMLACSHIP